MFSNWSTYEQHNLPLYTNISYLSFQPCSLTNVRSRPGRYTAGCSGLTTPQPGIITVHPVAILLSPKVGQEGSTRTKRLVEGKSFFLLLNIFAIKAGCCFKDC